MFQNTSSQIMSPFSTEEVEVEVEAEDTAPNDNFTPSSIIGGIVISTIHRSSNMMTDSQRCAVVANVIFWMFSFICWVLDRYAVMGRRGLVASSNNDAGSSRSSNNNASSGIGRWLHNQKIQPHDSLTYCSTNPQLGWKIFYLSAFNMIAVTPIIAIGAEFLFGIMYNNDRGQRHDHDHIDDTIGRITISSIGTGAADHRDGTMTGLTRKLAEDEWLPTIEIPKIFIMFAIVSVWFYTTHRMLHFKCFYKTIHKIHHSLTAPTAMGAVYTHPLEFVWGNVAGVALGPILTNAHPYTAYLWYALAMFDTCRVHSGYKFLGASRHDDHHNDYFNYNFGNRFMDTVGGTMAPPRRSSSSSNYDDNTSTKKSD